MAFNTDTRQSASQYEAEVDDNNGFKDNSDPQDFRLAFVKNTNQFDKDYLNYNFAKIEELFSSPEGRELLARTVGELLYPVGTVYMSYSDTRNPQDILGFGTWSRIAYGRFLIGQGQPSGDSADNLFFHGSEDTDDQGKHYTENSQGNRTYEVGWAPWGGAHRPPKHSHSINFNHTHTVNGSTNNADAAHTHTAATTPSGYQSSHYAFLGMGAHDSVPNISEGLSKIRINANSSGSYTVPAIGIGYGSDLWFNAYNNTTTVNSSGTVSSKHNHTIPTLTTSSPSGGPTTTGDWGTNPGYSAGGSTDLSKIGNVPKYTVVYIWYRTA